MVKNYYVILGIPFDAEPDTIRSAFRRQARRLHPDHGGPSTVRAFREASEAYEVLSDPASRARYDKALGTSDERRMPETPIESEYEPLVSDPMPITGDPETIRPSFEALFERLSRNFTGLHRPKAESEEPLNFELVLSLEEAERGIVIPFEIPVLERCVPCRGSGLDWLLPCAECDGSGHRVDHRTLDVRVPPRLPDGSVVDVSLSRLGVQNVWLRLHVRVAGH